MRLSDFSEKCSWFSQCWHIPTLSSAFQQKSKSFISFPRLVHKAAQLAHSLKPKLPFARASVWLQNGCIQKGVLFWRSQVLSDVNNVGDICIGWKRSTEHGLDGQLCGVIDIWWQMETKNCTAQDAKVARALKFPGTYNAPTFETTASLLRAKCCLPAVTTLLLRSSPQTHTH